MNADTSLTLFAALLISLNILLFFSKEIYHAIRTHRNTPRR